MYFPKTEVTSSTSSGVCSKIRDEVGEEEQEDKRYQISSKSSLKRNSQVVARTDFEERGRRKVDKRRMFGLVSDIMAMPRLPHMPVLMVVVLLMIGDVSGKSKVFS